MPILPCLACVFLGADLGRYQRINLVPGSEQAIRPVLWQKNTYLKQRVVFLAFWYPTKDALCAMSVISILIGEFCKKAIQVKSNGKTICRFLNL
ncbi:hypothetical protein SAMN04488056_10398 [Cohaesibacter marisflavi]|uniref:Uncharacterized protein n=1 Tax=Cohaesibacter marisflavi TaxID=655353 RepID=A0A1I5EAB5_9HYPH|nr:hypothetical protein [Cohaesibacter marisflavi]SFO08375.1 hypothetical protein SAMN04488056_10398 [Cohaesibacter marisflavi]